MPVPARLPARTLRAFRADLTDWFARHRRDLPWRSHRTPYRVWLSETMCQQTRVETVIPYFHRFLAAFPDVRALAAAPLEQVYKLWEGLGYYSRARNLHRAAGVIVRDHGGRFPADHAGWLALPGVGPYTAAAVSSLVLGSDHAVLDGNVIRVLARAFAVEACSDLPSTRAELQRLADRLLPPGRAGEFNEAIMELGALVCAPRSPECGACPLAAICQARLAGAPENFPVRRVKAKLPVVRVGAAVAVNARGRFLVARRPDHGLLGGLWEFPGGKIEEGETFAECVRRELREELGLDVSVGPELLLVRHTYSHFKLEMHVHLARPARAPARAIECAEFRWLDVAGMRALPFSRADLHVIDWLERAQERSARWWTAPEFAAVLAG